MGKEATMEIKRINIGLFHKDENIFYFFTGYIIKLLEKNKIAVNPASAWLYLSH